MTCCAALLALLAATAAPGGGPRPHDPEARARPHRLPDASLLAVRRVLGALDAWRAGAVPPAPRRARPGAPGCAGDQCQPQVHASGLQPRLGVSRTEAILASLSRSPLVPVAEAARFFVERNLRIDYFPGGATSERAWGRVMFSLRWQLDGPAAPAR